ncbi:MAG TPA: glycosyltransferase family 4 protein [Verrucomicrobiae bacterium]|nr:glycosyltransferase family 4 protein [Verrucomicrobiae bacterium]
MSHTRTKILLFGYLPPPYFGPSVTYQALLKSEFTSRFDVTFIDISTARNVADVETFRVGKLFRMARIILLEIYYLLTRRFDFCSCPISVNRNAFLRDALFLAIARTFRVPTIVYAHGNNLPDFYDRSSPFMKRVIKTTCSRAVGGIVMGNRLRPNLKRWLPQERIFPATDGVQVYSPMPQPPKDRQGISVLYLGNLIREKGVLVVLESAARIRKQRRDIRFIFAGAWFKGADEEAARELVLREGLADGVEFVGRVVGEQKWQLLVAADMLVFPTFYYYETLGLVLLEAMQAGLPVVTTSRASIPDIIEEGVNGLMVAEQDPLDLAEKVLRLANDPALRQRMGAANREKFHRLYTHEHYGQRMIRVFEELAARRDR